MVIACGSAWRVAPRPTHARPFAPMAASGVSDKWQTSKKNVLRILTLMLVVINTMIGAPCAQVPECSAAGAAAGLAGRPEPRRPAPRRGVPRAARRAPRIADVT